MQTSGSFIMENKQNYFPNSQLEFQRVVFSEGKLDVDKNYNFCRISQLNTSPWNIKIRNANNSANCHQTVNICNGETNFGIIRSYVNQGNFKHEPTNFCHDTPSRNASPGSRPIARPHQHRAPIAGPQKQRALLPTPFQKPDFRLPHSEIDHYLSPPAYHETLPRALPPPPIYSAPQPTVPQKPAGAPGEFLTESEIDNWVSKIAEEANSQACVLTWPEKGKTGGAGDDRADKGSQQPRRLRKQVKPRCSAQRYDPNFKGMMVEMHIKVENHKCHLRIKSSLGVKLSSLRMGSDDGHVARRSCCSIDEQPGGKIRVARPQGVKRVRHYAKECQSCGARRTQLWRQSENGKLLCNMCGIRYLKYRVRCSRCWHIPKCNSMLHTKCGCCGSSLCYVVTRQSMINCTPC